jgi:CheY-like chemotaxis protein
MVRSESANEIILLVEDDAEIREALQELLRLENYDVRIATNGQEGLDYLRNNNPPLLVLLDLMMPVMNGSQFCNLQKEDPLISDIPVILLSADHGIQQKAAALKADGFLKKPIDLDLLLATLQSYSQGKIKKKS